MRVDGRPVDGIRVTVPVARGDAPRCWMQLTARFYVRGGIFTTVVAEHRKPGWTPPTRVQLGDFERQSNTRG